MAACSQHALCQLNKPVPANKGSELSIGASQLLPIDGTIGNGYFTNTAGFNAGLYKPLIVKEHLTFSIHAGIGYTFGNKRQLATLPSPYKTTTPTSTAVSFKNSDAPATQTFAFTIGPRVDILLAKRFSISPVVQAAYIRLKQAAFSATQTTKTDSASYSYNLLSQGEVKTNGIGLTAGLRFQYVAGKIGLWAEGSYTKGPAIHHTVNTWQPNGNPNVDGAYSLSQLQNGVNVSTRKSSGYQSAGISAGISIRFGGRSIKQIHNDNPAPSTPPVIGQMVIWWRTGHWCNKGGLYCYIKNKIDLSFDIKNLEPDATLVKTSIELLNANTIFISSVAQASNLSAGTLEKFRDKKVDLKGNEYEAGYFRELFTGIHLGIPKAPIVFRPEDQHYEVINTTFEGKPVQIIEATEKRRSSLMGKLITL